MKGEDGDRQRDHRGWVAPPAPLPAEGLRDVARILMIRLRALGDVLLVTPAVHAVRERFPAAAISFLVDDRWAPLLLGNPDLEEILALPRANRPRGWAGLGTDLAFIRKIRRRRFDLVVDLFGNPRSAILTLLSGAPLRLGYDVRVRRHAYNVRQPRHLLTGGEPRLRYAAEVNLDMVRRLGADTEELHPRIYLTPEEREEAKALMLSWGLRPEERIVALNPAGSWPAKTWPPERFCRLGDLLGEDPRVRVLLTWGPGERKLVELVARGMKREAIISPPLALRPLAALLERVDVWVGNDSGPKHLVAALGISTVTLYGPTDARTWGPPGRNHVALRNEVPCGPCDRTECDDMRCLLSLSPERVAGEVMRLLPLKAPGSGGTGPPGGAAPERLRENE